MKYFKNMQLHVYYDQLVGHQVRLDNEIEELTLHFINRDNPLRKVQIENEQAKYSDAEA